MREALQEFLKLAGVGLFLSLGPEIVLDPSLELHHVGHDLCVLHAALKVGDEGRSEEHICFTDTLFPKEPLAIGPAKPSTLH